MKTESINALASLFECDRQTLVRALRTVQPDAETTPGRPTWKVSTAMNALMAHRASTGRVDSRRQQFSNGGSEAITEWADPLLIQLFAAEDDALAHMRAQTTLEARRKAAVAMKPLLGRICAATRERGRINGQDADSVDYRADHLFLVGLRNFESPCEWSEDEVRSALALE